MNKILLVGADGAFGTNVAYLNDHDEFTRSDFLELKAFPEGYDRYVLAATVHHNRDDDGIIIQDDDVFSYERKFYTGYVKEFIARHPQSVFVYMSTSLIGRVNSAYVRYKREVEQCFKIFPNVAIVRPYFIADTMRRHSTQDRVRRCAARFYSNDMVKYSLSVSLWHDIIQCSPGSLYYHADGMSTLKRLYTLPEYLFNS